MDVVEGPRSFPGKRNMRIQDHAEWLQQMFSRSLNELQTHPITFLKRTRRLMASIVAWLIGLLFLGVGCWILMLRFEGLVDRISPHNMTIGQMTVDGTESKAYAELLRARFDYHFRRPVAITRETGFLEMASLDAPDLFQTAEWFGAGGRAFRLTLASDRFVELARGRGWRGLEFREVQAHVFRHPTRKTDYR